MTCECYHDDINFIGERGVCWGTKEKEPCRCGGDETKCDFYPKRAAIVLSKDKAFEFKLDGDTSQIQVIKDMKKYGLAVLRPKTNADRIRAMSDEELADEILSWFNWLNAVEWDDKRIIDWLKQEVSTNG